MGFTNKIPQVTLLSMEKKKISEGGAAANKLPLGRADLDTLERQLPVYSKEKLLDLARTLGAMRKDLSAEQFEKYERLESLVKQQLDGGMATFFSEGNPSGEIGIGAGTEGVEV